MIIAKIILIILIIIFLWGFIFPYKFLEFYCRLLASNLKIWGIETQFKIKSTTKIKFLCLIFIIFISYILYLQATNQNKNNILNIDNNVNKSNSLILLKDGGAIEAKINKEDSENIYLQSEIPSINKKDIDTILRINNKDFLDVVFNRNSCHNFKYGPQIPDEHIQLMLRAAMSSPSGYNLKSWRFVVVKDKHQIQNLLHSLMNSDDNEAIGEGRLNANLMFVVCQENTTGLKIGYSDALLSSILLWLCAEYLNYAAAFVDIYPGHELSGTRKAIFDKELSLPKGVIPCFMILVGYYDEQKKATNKFDSSNIHYNVWN